MYEKEAADESTAKWTLARTNYYKHGTNRQHDSKGAERTVATCSNTAVQKDVTLSPKKVAIVYFLHF